MTSLKALLSFGFFLLLSLFPHRVIAQGELALYLDFYCHTPSQLASTATFPLSTCLVPIGAVSVAIKLLPACPNGTASLIMYDDTSCSRSTYSSTNSYHGWSDVTNCFYRYVTESVPGVMFTCAEPATNPQATSTTTITASIIAAVATGATSSSKGSSGSGSGNAATTSTGSGSAASASTTTNASGSSPTDSSTSKTPALSMSDKVAIGVGVGVGIPSILVAILAWWYPRHVRGEY